MYWTTRSPSEFVHAPNKLLYRDVTSFIHVEEVEQLLQTLKCRHDLMRLLGLPLYTLIDECRGMEASSYFDS